MDAVEEYTKDDELATDVFTFILSKFSHIFCIKIRVKNIPKTPNCEWFYGLTIESYNNKKKMITWSENRVINTLLSLLQTLYA